MIKVGFSETSDYIDWVIMRWLQPIILIWEDINGQFNGLWWINGF